MGTLVSYKKECRWHCHRKLPSQKDVALSLNCLHRLLEHIIIHYVELHILINTQTVERWLQKKSLWLLDTSLTQYLSDKCRCRVSTVCLPWDKVNEAFAVLKINLLLTSMKNNENILASTFLFVMSSFSNES